MFSLQVYHFICEDVKAGFGGWIATRALLAPSPEVIRPLGHLKVIHILLQCDSGDG